MLDVRRNGGVKIGYSEQGRGGGFQFPKRPVFVMDQIVITTNALETLEPEDVQIALKRHNVGDWGDVCQDDKQANDDALKHGSRLLSVYHDRHKTKFYIITEWDRSVTTVLLPSDY